MQDRNTKYKGIIFDLDGTLIDSVEDLVDALNRTLSHYGFESKSYAVGKTLIGRGLRMLVADSVPQSYAEDDVFLDEATEMIKAEYAKGYVAKTRPYDGIEDMLSTLKAKGIQYAVCTNKPDNAAKIIVKELFDGDSFVDIVGLLDSTPRKPDPTETLNICGKMGITPQECIYMGDTSVDYHTAKNAGMLPLLCAWGFTDYDKLAELDDAVVIRHPREVENIIDGAEA